MAANADYLVIERALRSKGFELIAGVDEAGRGPLAGPVAAAAVILSFDNNSENIVDSKQMTAKQREAAFGEITTTCLAWSVWAESVKVIDRIGILPATMRAMAMAVRRLALQPDYVIVDGNRLPALNCPGEAIVNGDARSRSIAAASIIAKVIRDRLLIKLGKLYPEYGFERHKGYGTAQHIHSINNSGITKHHRLTFSPVRQFKLTLANG
ncbi:MAG: ribonuclease HII [Calditrichaeota bacterium]|nr:ribonuclease HII [Calditrichota bacterium]